MHDLGFVYVKYTSNININIKALNYVHVVLIRGISKTGRQFNSFTDLSQ